ncbi:hypothetical protein BJ742DRAFT_735105 [Cladochytrium replicatum]|nr:hypothetical protein BJ742DRAFT_735105 [Cladochytrium replicatum]
MVQLEKDAEVVCWITVSVAAGSIIALTAGLLWTIQQRKVTFLDWPRFQQLAFSEIVLVMENSPDRLATHAIVEPFVSDQGTPLLGGPHSPPSNRFLQPGRFFQILHVTLSVLGVVLFLKMELANILVNLQSTNNEALKNASPSRLSDNSGTVQSPPFGHFVPDHRQRTILLFFAFLFTDLTGLFLYGLSFLPITTNVKRPLQDNPAPFESIQLGEYESILYQMISTTTSDVHI